MIARLRGTLAGKAADSVVLDVNGVGYHVWVTPRALAELPGLGEEVVLHTHLHVREDQLTLFGFPSDVERDVFQTLLGASGVGPKLGLAILATLDPAELRAAVAGDDVGALEMVPGVGKRTAQKLILELRPRLAVPDGGLPSGDGSVGEVREALEALGFGAAEIGEVLRGMPADASTEEMLQSALKGLATP